MMSMPAPRLAPVTPAARATRCQDGDLRAHTTGRGRRFRERWRTGSYRRRVRPVRSDDGRADHLTVERDLDRRARDEVFAGDRDRLARVHGGVGAFDRLRSRRIALSESRRGEESGHDDAADEATSHNASSVPSSPRPWMFRRCYSPISLPVNDWQHFFRPTAISGVSRRRSELLLVASGRDRPIPTTRAADRPPPVGDDGVPVAAHAAVLLRALRARRRHVRVRRQDRARSDVLRDVPLSPARGGVAPGPRRRLVPHEGRTVRDRGPARRDGDRAFAGGRDGRATRRVGDVVAEVVGIFVALAVHARMRRTSGS